MALGDVVEYFLYYAKHWTSLFFLIYVNEHFAAMRTVEREAADAEFGRNRPIIGVLEVRRFDDFEC